jgi:hypothetical protein
VRSVESETITTAYAGFRIDKPYAQQRFYLDATATAYSYANFSELDFTGLNYFGAWYWHLTPRISGSLSASRTETPTQFSYTLSRQSNVATDENYVFNLAGNVSGGWHVLLGASQVDRTSEQSSLQSVPDYSEYRGEAGIRYLFRPGNQVDAIWRRVDGTQAAQVLGGVVVANEDTTGIDGAASHMAHRCKSAFSAALPRPALRADPSSISAARPARSAIRGFRQARSTSTCPRRGLSIPSRVAFSRTTG